jgi:hypothetical protein
MPCAVETAAGIEESPDYGEDGIRMLYNHFLKKREAKKRAGGGGGGGGGGEGGGDGGGGGGGSAAASSSTGSSSSKGLTLKQLLSQWDAWKTAFPAWRLAHPQADVIALMKEMVGNRPEYQGYSGLRDLCAIALTLTFSTSIVESGNSVLGWIKNILRARMSDDTLDDYLQIILNGPPEMSVFLFYVLFIN